MKTTNFWTITATFVGLALAACSMDAAEWDKNHPLGTAGTAGVGGAGGNGGNACPNCSGTGGTGGSTKVCSAGSLAACECTPGVWGQKTCNADEKGYGACQCNQPGTFCRDADGDGFGNPAQCGQYQTPPSGYVGNNADCNDACNTCHPGGIEICGNGLDEDCNGSDLACGQNYTYYPDNDHDGHGAQGSQGVQFSSPTPPYGYAVTADDCDDNNAAVYNTCGQICTPGASISCSCGNGSYGNQICNADGKGYGTCQNCSGGTGGNGGSGGTGGSGPHPTNCGDTSGQKVLHLVMNVRSGVTIQVRGAAVFHGIYVKDDSPAMGWCGWWQDAGHYNNAPLLTAVQHLEADILVAIESNGKDILLNGVPQWMAWRGQITLLDPGNTDIWHARYGFTVNPVGHKAALQADESCTLYFDGKAITDNYCRALPGQGLHLVPNLTTGQNGQVDNPIVP